MSLLLREATQQHLDAVDLSEYHTSMNHNKNPTIVGECGKPLFTLHGVTFSRAAPTVAEINIAAKLVKEFLAKHSKAIDSVLKAQVARHAATSKLDKYTAVHPGFKVGSLNTFGVIGSVRTVRWKALDSIDFTTRVSLSDATKFVTQVSIMGPVDITPTSAKKLIPLTTVDVKVSEKLLELQLAADDATASESRAVNFLNSCGV